MRAKEFIVEYRDRMYQYIKSIVPTWPDYVVKDWLYANFVRGHTTSSDADLEKRQETARSKMFRYQYADQMNKLARSGKTGRQLPPGYQQPYRSNQDLKATLLAKRNAKDSEPEYAWTFATIKKDIPRQLADIGLTVDTKWQLVPNMKFTKDMWEPKTLKRLQARAGGNVVAASADPDVHIPTKDAERHATQAALAQQQGGVRKEPVILIKTPQGYELLEGWHRTIQHFAKYPNGYTGPAYVAIAQDKQGVAEGKSNTIPKIGINVRNDKDIDYASLIVDGKKKYESRKTDSLRPYVGKTVGVVRTGNGSAVAIGQVTIGEPIAVNAEKFDLLRKKHLVPKGSKFDIDSDGTKYLYPMINPVRWENEKSIKHKGIVSRKIQESMAYINQSNEGGNLEGYVVDSDKPQLTNYLSSQGADNNLINKLKQKYKTIAIIRNMYVDEEQRDQGYGNQLVSDAIDDAAGNHANAIICVADMSEDNAIDLVKWYENFGFEVVGKAGSDPVMVLEL